MSLMIFIPDIANSTVKFDSKGDGLARYTIYNYQRNEMGKTDYKVIGKWYNELKIDVDQVMFWSTVPNSKEKSKASKTTTLSPNSVLVDLNEDLKHKKDNRATTGEQNESVGTEIQLLQEDKIPTSVCSLPCKVGEIMIMNTVSYKLTECIFLTYTDEMN